MKNKYNTNKKFNEADELEPVTLKDIEISVLELYNVNSLDELNNQK